MKGKKLIRLVAMLFAITMLPVNAYAAESTTQSAEGGLIVDKTATLEDDGTYTFNLEAFATGETITITKTDPTDVVLVLDVSGSMDEDYSYVLGKDWQFTKQRVIDTPTNVYHKCPDGTYSTIQWTETGREVAFVGGVGTYRYVCDNCKATRKWGSPRYETIPGEGNSDPWNLYEYSDIEHKQEKMTAMKAAAVAFVNGVAEKNAELTDATQQHRVSIVKFADDIIKTNVGNDVDSNGYNYTQTVTAMTEVTADTKDSIVADINSLEAGGATAADKGLEVAQSTLSNSGAGRQKVVILLTDGDPNHQSGFDESVASTAVTTAGNMKDAGVTIYTVGLVTGADPSDTTTNFNKYLNAVSNNYPNATVTNSSSFTVNLGEGGNNGYYKETKNSGSLSDVFTAIQESIGTSTVTLDEEAILKDVVADGFVLPNSFNESNITVQKIKFLGRNKYGERVFDTTGTTLDAVVTFDQSNNTINVSGFDYAENCLIDGTKIDSNDFTAATQGYKLVVTITGVEATEALATDEALNTNKMVSGVYTDSTESELAAAFPIPQTILTSKAYVLDYAKKVTVASSDWGQDVSLLKVRDDMSLATKTLTADYGEFSVSNSNLSFDPDTMKWDGFDTVYALGKTSNADIKAVSANGNGNVWTKLNFIPANNVYYEDDFITTDSGKVGIVYSGTWTKAAGKGNTETPNTDVHGGWQNVDLADDKDFTDGSVHESSTAGATATFTFTGTGVDVYSKTTMTTGAVKAQLYKGEEVKAAALTKVFTVDNKSASGDYYQIPTVSFMNLDHDTYTVKLTVVSTSDARSTYYLDGIRVYNPLAEDNEYTDEVMDAYGDEIGAVFTEVRDILINWSEDIESEEVLNGVVFIDEKENSTGTSTSVIGEYVEYGPKNEVYLAKDKSIGFEVIGNPEDKVCVGIKAPAGVTTARVTNGNSTSTLNINASSDLYYEITPNADGLVVIENTGDSLLSITKLKMTGETAVGEVSVMSLLSYADTFDTLPVVDYEQQPEEPDVDVDTDGDIDNGGDVEIENPEVEEDTQLDSSVEVKKWVKNAFAQLMKWLGR